MVAALAFGLTLFAAVLLSERAERTILSTSVLFLVAGFVLGEGVLGVVHLALDAPGVETVAELALFATLFSDGTRLPIAELRASWHLPARALVLGLPLTLVLTGVAARYLVGLSWTESFLLGAVLAPTDPVFAAAIVREERLSVELRRLLNVESGLNDGLALPVVLALIYALGHDEQPFLHLVGQVVLGVLVGSAVAWAADRLERLRWFGAHQSYRALGGLAVGLIVLSVAKLSGANPFLAAFAGGMTAISLRPELSAEFRGFVEEIANLLKFGGLFVLGAIIDPGMFARVGWGAYVLVAFALLVARPAPVAAVLVRSDLSPRERAVAAWFGPKGFASVLYALMVLRARGPEARYFFDVAALVIAASIVAHSSTDVILADWLVRKDGGRKVRARSPRAPHPATPG